MARYKIPTFFYILSLVRFIWFFHVRFSSNKTPKKVIWSARFIKVLFIFNVDTSGILSLFLTLWDNVNLVLSAFRDSLSSLNQWLIFDNSFFAVLKSEWYLSANQISLYHQQTLSDRIILMLEVNRLYKARIARVQKCIPLALHIEARYFCC